MLEIREIEVNGQKLKVQEMDWDTAEKYSDDGKALLNKGDAVTVKDWNERTIAVVLDNLKAAGNEDITVEQFKKKFGIKGTRKILDAILEVSGMKPIESGEAKAATA